MCNVNRPEEHYAEWHKSVAEGYILRDPTYMRCLKQRILRHREQNGGYQGMRAGEMGDAVQQVQSFSHARWVSCRNLLYDILPVHTLRNCLEARSHVKCSYPKTNKQWCRRKLLEVKGVFIILMLVMASWVYAYLQTYQVVFTKYAWFLLCASITLQ